MPPRDDNDKLFYGAVGNIRFTLPDDVELTLGEAENVTFEGSTDTPDGSFPIRLNPSEAITGTLEVDTPTSREMSPEPTAGFHRVSDAMSGLAYGAAANASLFGTWLQDLNSAWENLGDNYKLKDESEYQGTNHISFEELMDFGGESK